MLRSFTLKKRKAHTSINSYTFIHFAQITGKSIHLFLWQWNGGLFSGQDNGIIDPLLTVSKLESNSQWRAPLLPNVECAVWWSHGASAGPAVFFTSSWLWTHTAQDLLLTFPVSVFWRLLLLCSRKVGKLWLTQHRSSWEKRRHSMYIPWFISHTSCVARDYAERTQI